MDWYWWWLIDGGQRGMDIGVNWLKFSSDIWVFLLDIACCCPCFVAIWGCYGAAGRSFWVVACWGLCVAAMGCNCCGYIFLGYDDDYFIAARFCFKGNSIRPGASKVYLPISTQGCNHDTIRIINSIVAYSLFYICNGYLLSAHI